jgi:hypothetical protein
MGSKGIGEIGIVGTAAAVANAVFHATGRRVRELPIRSTACSPVILVTGATGNIGGATLEALVAQGHPVRAMSRSERTWPEGVEGVTGDLDDPDSLVRAADGVEAVFLLSGYAGTERPPRGGPAAGEDARGAAVVELGTQRRRDQRRRQVPHRVGADRSATPGSSGRCCSPTRSWPTRCSGLRSSRQGDVVRGPFGPSPSQRRPR